MPRIFPPEDLVEALEKLQERSSKSAPDLSTQVEKLIVTLRTGQETRKNDRGLAEFQRHVERLTMFANRIKMNDITQHSRVLNLKAEIQILNKQLKGEVEEGSDTYPLNFFADFEKEDTPYDTFNRKFGSDVINLERITCPELAPKATQSYYYDGARVETTHGSVASGNTGEQAQSFSMATVRAFASVGSDNDATGRFGPRGLQALIREQGQ